MPRLSKLSESELRTLQCWARSFDPGLPRRKTKRMPMSLRFGCSQMPRKLGRGAGVPGKAGRGEPTSPGGTADFSGSESRWLACCRRHQRKAAAKIAGTHWLECRTKFKLTNGEEWVQRKDGFLSAEPSSDIEQELGDLALPIFVPELGRGIQVKKAK